MFAPLTVDDLLIISASESRKLAEEAERVLMSDPVPTCPEWTVRQLVEHLGGVHRWATMIISEGLLQLPDESLFDSGLLDSFALPDVLSALEKAFSIKIPDSDLNPRKFDSISRIESYIESRL